MGSATTFSFEELVKLHRGFVDRGQVKRIGRMIKIVLGGIPQGVTLGISATEIAKEGRTLDWFDQGPVIGLSPGEVDLLVASPILPLPEKPDPEWIAPLSTQAEIDKAVAESGRWTPPRPPLVKQLPEDRGARKIRGANILLFEPVYQVLFRPEGINVFGCVEALTDDASGTVMTFVWNFDEGRGYFYGGRFIVKI